MNLVLDELNCIGMKMVLWLQNNSLFRKTHTHTHIKARSNKYHNAKNLTLKFYRKKKKENEALAIFH